MIAPSPAWRWLLGPATRDIGLGRPVLSLCGKDVDLVLGGAPFLPLPLLSVSPEPD